jgi:acetoin utilization deacetylase AcuC-like enzyme
MPVMEQEATNANRSQQPTALICDDIFTRHKTGRGHPECPDRYRAVIRSIDKSDFAGSLMRLEPRRATDEEIVRAHDNQYLEIVRRDIQSGAEQLSTGDTTVCPDSLEAALHAAGGACVAVDAVMQSRAKNACCVVRPPGHHATPNRGMGFCIFNNIAVAARYAQKQHGISKVLIVDWDVHHGNGTQDIFYEDGSVLFFSTHQSPLYPGTGPREETGQGQGLGTTVNCPLPAGSGRREIFKACEDGLLPRVATFKPELVLVSAGFDSRIDDPLGDFRLTDDDFSDLTKLVVGLAKDHAEGRVISVLEGGYNLDGLASAAVAHCRSLNSA